MVMCGMIGCSNRSGRDKVSFYRLPGTQRAADPDKKELQMFRRAMWLTRICRKDILNDDRKLLHFRVCEKHFIRNAPSLLQDINDPDWAPSLHLGHDYYKKNKVGKKVRSEIEDLLYDPSRGKNWHPLLLQKKYYERGNMDEAVDIIKWRSSMK
ncbi:THAP-type domain-containing protein [Caerostris extrusa]|uniref:THAP-type domain-containing protein n=1 Tax=Caerostris extrusa TaxID=172846 RepID=A0AAV4RVM0_CAEEX|nr:THAP-type domain-containing protein [Caerostris extrusa]